MAYFVRFYFDHVCSASPKKILILKLCVKPPLFNIFNGFKPSAVIKYPTADVLYSEFQIRAGCAKKIPKNRTLFRNKIFDFFPILFQI